MNQRIVLFDGVCNFCNFWVQFALKRDSKGKLLFTSLQGETAKTILPQYGIDPAVITTVIFLDNGKIYKESSAALRICRYLNGGWKIFYVLILIPPFLRDNTYKWIGKNRYKWFGRKETCMLPTPDQRKRFLD